MYLITLILFLVIPLFYYSKVYFKNWLNPVTIYFIPWLILFTLFSLKIYELNNPSFKVTILLLVSFFSFILGIEIYFFKKGVPSLKVDINRMIDINKNRLKWAILILTIISIIADIIILKNLILVEGDILKIISRAALIRAKLVKGELNIFSYYGYLSVLSYPAVILSGIYASRYGFVKPLSWMSFIPVLLFEFIFMGRANILWAFFLYFSVSAMIHYLSGKKFFTKKNIVKYILTFVVLLLLINIVYFFRGGGEIHLYHKKYLRYEEPENIFLRILYSSYPYITAPLPALDILIERTESPLLMGGKTFRPLIIFAESKYKTYYYPFVRVPIPANIYTYLGDVYMDFGLMGFIFVPFLFGFVSSIFYSSSFSTPTIFNLAMTSIIYSQLGLSLFYSRFSFGNIWITIFMFVILMKYFKAER